MGRVSKTARKVIGWPSSILRSATCGMASGWSPRPSSSSKTTRFTMASATSPMSWSRKRFFTTSAGTLPGRKPGSFSFFA